MLQSPESNMVVTDLNSPSPRIMLKGDELFDTPSQTLVSELMIMANEAVGKLGKGLAT